MTNNNTKRGFIGLLGLLITAAIIAFLAIKLLPKLYSLPQPSLDDLPAATDGGSPTKIRSAIQQAEDAARAIETRSRGE